MYDDIIQQLREISNTLENYGRDLDLIEYEQILGEISNLCLSADELSIYFRKLT